MRGSLLRLSKANTGESRFSLIFFKFIMSYLYILESKKNSTFYVGSTIDLLNRMEEHCSGKSKYTSNLLPLKLVFSQKFKSIKEARKAELWVKRQKDRSFIVRIIHDGYLQKSF